MNMPFATIASHQSPIALYAPPAAGPLHKPAGPPLRKQTSCHHKHRSSPQESSIGRNSSSHFLLDEPLAGSSSSGLPVLGLIFSTRATLLSSCWFLTACPLSSVLMSLAGTLHFLARSACVILYPSWPRRVRMAAPMSALTFCTGTMSSERSTLVRRWPSTPGLLLWENGFLDQRWCIEVNMGCCGGW